jgi:hypothetical protein
MDTLDQSPPQAKNERRIAESALDVIADLSSITRYIESVGTGQA